MLRFITRLAAFTGLLIVVCVMFLTLPVFSTARSNLAIALLADVIEDRDAHIGDVSVSFFPSPAIDLIDLRIKANEQKSKNYISTSRIKLSVSTSQLAKGVLDLETIEVDGFVLDIAVNEDGTADWRSSSTTRPRPIEREFPLLSGLLADRDIDFANSSVKYRHAPSGFVFDFDLDAFSSRQTRRNTQTVLRGNGRINGEPFEVIGDFPDGLAFDITMRFASGSVSFSGEADDVERRTGFSSDLKLDVESVEEFMRILGLQPVWDGSLAATAQLVRTPTRLSMNDLDLVAKNDLHSVEVRGEISNLINWNGADVSVDYTNRSQKSILPGVPESFADIAILDAAARIVSTSSELVVEGFEVQTNLANPSIRRLGPIGAERVFRTPEGQIRVEGIELFGGPPGTPIVTVTGEIDNLLDLSGMSVEGELNFAFADAIFGPTVGISEFGNLTGSFAANNANGPLALTKLKAHTADAGLWNLEFNLRSKDISDPDNLRGETIIDFPDLKLLATSIGLKPPPLSRFTLGATLEGEDETLVTKAEISIDQSKVQLLLRKTFENQLLSFLGEIVSERLDINTVSEFVSFAARVSELETDTDEQSSVQPIWLDDVMKPLILDDPFLAVDDEELIEALYAKIDVDIRNIRGLPGFTRLNSTFTLEDGAASLRPVRFSLPSGFASFGLYLDTIDDPDAVQASGQIRSVSLQEVAQKFEIPIDMTGTVSGDFRVFVNLSSLDRALDTAYGRANLSMGPGTIGTSLVKLAGLGVIPWLFSQDLRQGFSNINCIEAPLVIQPGRVFSNGFVLETQRVQVVAKGTADYGKNTIVIHAEPRRVGQPLSRSFFPVEVYGELSAPKVRRLRNSLLSIPDSDATARATAENRQPCKMDKLQ